MESAAPLNLLIVEDDPLDAELEVKQLRDAGLTLNVRRVETREELEPTLAAWRPDLVISDFSLPELDGLTILDLVRKALPDVPFLFVSGTIGEERAIDAMRHGATDYVVKHRISGLVVRVRKALDEAREKARRLQLEEELRQSQKMDALGRLAGAVAHDFNNLLTAILSYGELAISKLKPGEPGREEVEHIYKAGESAVSLTRQLLSFSRKAPLSLRAVCLNDVVHGMKPLIARLLGSDVELVVTAAPDLPAVWADAGGLEQILLNLAVNARDAMPKGGRLTIETSRAAGKAESSAFKGPGPASGVVALRVTDSGIGMDPETLARVFEPFFTTKGPGKGTGLGLSTVYGLVQHFGGSVAVASEQGRGSTFWICLQEAPASQEAAPPAAPPLPLAGSGTILVAEDSPPIRRLVGHALSALGYQVLEAVDGKEAVARFEKAKGRVDLLITDAVMPGLGGADLIEILHKQRPDLKVLVMTGTLEGMSASTVGALHGYPHLAKPFTPSVLGALVRNILHSSGTNNPPPGRT